MEVSGVCPRECTIRHGEYAIYCTMPEPHGAHEYGSKICVIKYGASAVVYVACLYEDGYVEVRGPSQCVGMAPKPNLRELCGMVIEAASTLSPEAFKNLANRIVGSLGGCAGTVNVNNL